jgi:hypothetical protein
MKKLLNNKLIKTLAPFLILFAIAVLVFAGLRSKNQAAANNGSFFDNLKATVMSFFTTT